MTDRLYYVAILYLKICRVRTVRADFSQTGV